MEFSAYKLSYYLNALHSMDDKKENAHAHTFTISLYLEDLGIKGFIDFKQLDHIVKNFLDRFVGNYMNVIEPFDKILPTIESMATIFYEELKLMLSDMNYDLIKLDISENPLRVYSISDRLYLGSK